MTRKKSIVTGGASGLGPACARRLSADGVEVIRVDIASNADIRVDVSDWASVESVAKEVGAIDVLVNGAGTLDRSNPFGRLRTTSGPGRSRSTSKALSTHARPSCRE
jgi:NAD(P)-dependent dehydrogenase (short-subunit alcohol dehydrogenase family)